jgi:hypothetical protein
MNPEKPISNREFFGKPTRLKLPCAYGQTFNARNKGQSPPARNK